ncbi:hypothetical protein QNI16_23700 [Cytophagaceae bacterium YF14B1]|uniref:Amine oxidase n=1 Tax=Xanthocytophaga flava TaxID=3048013 RepID=A0AAE3QUB9_9BACT|nr:hypothetical protein [Xanthocytophaga flavus]MDJ1483523.1 hypothetical protein [Xanthocytophaga flavus]
MVHQAYSSIFHSLAKISLLLVIAVLVWNCTSKKTEIANGTPFVVDEVFKHPLDPLDTNEIKSVKAILLASGKVDTNYLFFLINLKEPSKSDVLAYEAGKSFKREAFASLYQYDQNKVMEAVIDLTDKKVLSLNEVKGVEPGAFDKDSIIKDIVRNDTSWVAALKKRNIHPDSIKCWGQFVGELGVGTEGHRELIAIPSYKNKKFSSLPIAGLYAFVDMTARKIIKLVDEEGKYDKPTDIGYFNADSAVVSFMPDKPLKIQQPDGVGFTTEGYKIVGQKWAFRIGIHNREGLVMYDVRYNDNGRWRPVMYRGSMAEMYVPYGSPDSYMASNNYFDGGVYRMGQQADKKEMKPMHLGDVPENAVLFPAYYHNEKGEPMMLDSAVAVYEQSGGTLARHGKFTRGARELVTKYFTRIGNYDYAFKWILKEDGEIKVETELTGVVAIRSVHRTVDLPGSGDETYEGNYYGTMVTPHAEAVNHQHFFCFRLDMDVDGATNNNIEEMNVVPVPVTQGSPYRNTFITQMTRFVTEKEAQRDVNMTSNRHWMIANSQTNNGLGHPSAYVLMPGHNAKMMSDPSAPAHKMGDFLDHQLWVTQYKDGEQFPAGDYPITKGAKDGLPAWSAADRSLENQDLVLWYNMGVTHIVRPEEWPIMNEHRLSFSLMPFGFFSKNPVIGMPQKAPMPVIANADNRLSLCITPKKGINAVSKNVIAKNTSGSGRAGKKMN